MSHKKKSPSRTSPDAHGDGGFTLIEAVVALLVLGLVMTGLAAASVSAIRTSLLSRQNQQAADFISTQIERYRALNLDAVANVAADLTGDTRVGTCSGKPCLDPGTGTEELLVLDDGGGVVPHEETMPASASNNTTYTAWTYATVPAGQDPDYERRLTVFVSWETNGRTHTRSNSTIVSYGTSGLPLPKFTLAPLGPTEVSVNPGARVHYGFTLTNLGAPDHWDVTAADSGSAPWAFAPDANGDGQFTGDDAAVANRLADTTGNGVVDTGLVQAGDTFTFWAYRDVPSTASASSSTLTVTATSAAQPTAPSGTASLSDTTTVVIGVISSTPTVTPSSTPSATCPATSPAPSAAAASGYTLRTYYLHNQETVGDTVAQSQMVMSTGAPSATTLYAYSTDLSSLLGRQISSGGTLTSTDPRGFADWRVQFGADTSVSGTATLSMWVGSAGTPPESVSLTAQLYTYTNHGNGKGNENSYQVAGVGGPAISTITPFTCSGFQRLDFSLPVSSPVSLDKNDFLGVRITSNTDVPVMLGYDVVGAYPAALILPKNPA